jgi:hypothetical protein
MRLVNKFTVEYSTTTHRIVLEGKHAHQINLAVRQSVVLEAFVQSHLVYHSRQIIVDLLREFHVVYRSFVTNIDIRSTLRFNKHSQWNKQQLNIGI